MNRRFLAIARFNADPESAILEHVRRIAKRAGIDLSNPLVAHGSTDAALRAAAHHELVAASPFALILSSTRSVRPSKDERVLTGARGPPNLQQTQQFQLAFTCENAPAYPRLDAPPPPP